MTFAGPQAAGHAGTCAVCHLLLGKLGHLGCTASPHPCREAGASGALSTPALFLSISTWFCVEGSAVFAGFIILLFSSSSILQKVSRLPGKGTLKNKVQFSRKGFSGYDYIMGFFFFFVLLSVYFVLKGRCFLLSWNRATFLW